MEAAIFPSAASPTLLAPGVISTGNESDELFPALSPDSTTLYFVRRAPGGRFTIYVSNYLQGSWTAPRITSFSGTYADQEPSLSPDGQRLFFTSNRPIEGTEPIDGRDVWVVERTSDGWSEPRHVGPPVSWRPPVRGAENRFLGLARGPRVDRDGTLCFWADRPNDSYGHTDFYCSALVDGSFQEPQNLGSPPNSEHYETGLWIRTDRTLMFFSRDCADCDNALGAADLYVSRRSNGSWTEPENLGPAINSPAYDFAPVLSPSGRYLLFTSNRNVDGEGAGRQNIYVVDLSKLGFWP